MHPGNRTVNVRPESRRTWTTSETDPVKVSVSVSSKGMKEVQKRVYSDKIVPDETDGINFTFVEVLYRWCGVG